MAEDEDVSRRYRELAREEPPRHVDEAIRAAARRAVASRPAPLVGPAGRQRWYFPLAAAAIIVLAVAVTLHVEREQPAEELVVAQKSEPAQESKRELSAQAPAAPELRAAPPAATPAAPAPSAPSAQDAPRVMQDSRADAAATATPPAEPPARSAMGSRAESMQRSAPGSLAKLAENSPEQWLAAIAELRAQARHDEADKQLAEFRKRYPEYQIPQTMRERVEKSTR